MSRPSLSHRHLTALVWILNIPLAQLVEQSFVGVRRLYLERCDHVSVGQFTVALVPLMGWTAFLALNLLCGMIAWKRGDGSAPGGPSGG